MESLNPPSHIDFTGANVSERWKKHKQKWELYALASGATEKPEKIQCALILHVTGEEGVEIYNKFSFDDNEKIQIKTNHR